MSEWRVLRSPFCAKYCTYGLRWWGDNISVQINVTVDTPIYNYNKYQNIRISVLSKIRCKILMLDDINVDKCKLIVQEIESDPTWKIIKKENVRNGYLIAERS